MNTTDGLMSVAGNIGTPADKAANVFYYDTAIVGQQAPAAYMTTLFGKAVDIRAEDSFREWRAWIANPEQIEAIEREEARLNLKIKFVEADRLAQIHGGAVIYMSLPGNPALPVNLNSLGLGQWKFATVLPKDRASAGERETDPLFENYGQPKYYNIGTSKVHPSRVIRFVGVENPDKDTNWDGFGRSAFAVYRDALNHLNLAMSATAAMIPEAKLDIFKIPGLTEKFATAEYEGILTRRLTAANALKSITNALIIDAGDGQGNGGEEYEQKTLAFAGLPDVIDRFALMFSAVTDIPQTRLYGRAPQGQNATGESDMQNWAQTIAARQELKISPAINGSDEILIRSALGTRPADIWYDWRPIYTVSEKVAAETEKLYAETFAALTGTGEFETGVLARAALSRMIDTGRYGDLESAVADAGNDGLIDPDEKEASELARMQAEAEIAAAGNPGAVE